MSEKATLDDQAARLHYFNDDWRKKNQVPNVRKSRQVSLMLMQVLAFSCPAYKEHPEDEHR